MDLLQQLLEMSGVPGREERVRTLILKELKPLVDEIRTDTLGNVIGFLRGSGDSRKPRKKIMLAAHMDEIGFVVSHIDDKGFLRFQPVGGFDPRTLMAQRVTVLGRKDLAGVIGSKPIHILTEQERKKQLELKDYFIDLGMPKKDVEKFVKVGDPITMHRQMEVIGQGLTCKTFDDRVGVYCMIEAVRKSKRSSADLYVVATTQEEVGLRGAFAASSGIVPDVGIAIDITLANDIPGAAPQDEINRLGGGTSICVLNGSHISNHKLQSRFEELAKKKRIKYQMDLLPKGGTDAAAMQRVQGGAAVITISIPIRYAHSTVEMAFQSDIQATTDLLAAYIADPGDMRYEL